MKALGVHQPAPPGRRVLIAVLQIYVWDIRVRREVLGSPSIACRARVLRISGRSSGLSPQQASDRERPAGRGEHLSKVLRRSYGAGRFAPGRAARPSHAADAPAASGATGRHRGHLHRPEEWEKKLRRIKALYICVSWLRLVLLLGGLCAAASLAGRCPGTGRAPSAPLF